MGNTFRDLSHIRWSRDAIYSVSLSNIVILYLNFKSVLNNKNIFKKHKSQITQAWRYIPVIQVFVKLRQEGHVHNGLYSKPLVKTPREK